MRNSGPNPIKGIRLINKINLLFKNNPHNGKFIFLNKEVIYSSNKINWNDPNQEKLWLYNLHYFDYLIPLCQNPNQENFETIKKIIGDWIDKNPIGRGNGWEPYSLSLRIVNWIFVYSAYNNSFKKEEPFESKFLKSLYQQANYLTYFVEYHIQANHLFTNFKALVFAGLFFNNLKWLNMFVPKIINEIKEQILPDGGHYERSPMYQNIIITDFIDLVNIIYSLDKTLPDNVKSLKELLEEKLKKMMVWQNRILQPDGEVPLLGDSAFQIALKSQSLQQYYDLVVKKKWGSGKQNQVSSLTNSGYHVFRSDDQYLVFDTGELGVSYQPGHAHCDILSFEYSYKTERFFVDTGVGNYLENEVRLKARSIYAHNTAVVNEMDQAQLWKAFRMAKRVSDISSNKDENWVEGSYENKIDRGRKYHHSRKIELIDHKFFALQDTISSARLTSLEFLFHLAPGSKIDIENNQAKITIGNKTIVLIWESKLNPQLKDWFYTPEFGKIIPTKMLSFVPKVIKEGTYSFIISPFGNQKEANDYFKDSLN
ncbi:MAG: alginate lyase family protein [Calditrichaeota bacterium]|nr:alginate lyase family protein [Calditrichota bacterium]